MAKTYDIVLDKGSDYSIAFEFRDERGELVNYQNSAFRAQIRSGYENKYPEDELSTENERIYVDENGYVVMYFPAAVTENYPWLMGVYDLKVEHEDGAVQRLVEGRLMAREWVTR